MKCQIYRLEAILLFFFFICLSCAPEPPPDPTADQDKFKVFYSNIMTVTAKIDKSYMPFAQAMTKKKLPEAIKIAKTIMPLAPRR
jgi:hypothetical protein